MWNFINPYLLYIKIALFVAALAGTGYVVHQWDERGYEAAKAAALEKADSEYRASVAMFKQRIVELGGINDDIVVKNQALKAKLDIPATQQRKEIADATEKFMDETGLAVLQPSALFTVEFGRVWNAAVDRANQRVPATGQDSAGATEPDIRPSDITREAILENEADILKQCGKWRADLDSIREWDARAYPEKK